MSISPVSSDWFKNIALLSISTNLPTMNSANQQIPSGDFFQSILQAMLLEGESSTPSQLQQSNGSFWAGTSPILDNIKDLSHIVNSTTSLDFSEVSLEKLNSTLKGKLSNLGEQFIEAGKAFNINPNLLASVAMHETGNGKSQAVYEKNNIAGMMGKNGLRHYDSVSESIHDMARNLRKNYLDKGLDSIAKIGGKYAPVGANNDPTGLNNHWVKGVNNFFGTLV
ncbi:glucosaminidase domain-containing protein [Neobacillus sp. OS1-33]|uniref:glucosaminidase domain-containing protein n=1 Tax=Neobacillus sp. OS1-33 TaxID=3070683 RepID=UPI0027E0B94B|nr:glucosaminidase domain-containing protein [Neobacillus sp. OS1-33]WML24756.1 glucosaminidase domain-containing protein [Neobacillus sp. OS1-33]